MSTTRTVHSIVNLVGAVLISAKQTKQTLLGLWNKVQHGKAEFSAARKSAKQKRLATFS